MDEEALPEKLGYGTKNPVFYASEEKVEKHNLETELAVLTMHRQPLGSLQKYIVAERRKNLAHSIKILYSQKNKQQSGSYSLRPVSKRLNMIILLW